MQDLCKFCGGDELRPDMLPIAEMAGGSLYFMRDQTHPGRLLLAAKRHVRKVTDLTDAEYSDLTTSVYLAAKALTAVYAPDKINYLIFGDTGTHLHVHIVPKYQRGKDWGRVFLTDEPEPLYLPEEEYAQHIAKLREALQATD